MLLLSGLVPSSGHLRSDVFKLEPGVTTEDFQILVARDLDYLRFSQALFEIADCTGCTKTVNGRATIAPLHWHTMLRADF